MSRSDGEKSLLITGFRGTVAPVVARAVQRDGFEAVGWNRGIVPETDLADSLEFLESCQPQKVYHIGLGPPDWAALIAEWCCENDRSFLFTSTASVFAGNSERPYTIADRPDATDEYGRYKYCCELGILDANPDALLELESLGESGLFHLDGNPGLSIHEIGKRLGELHASGWRVRMTTEPHYCNLMRDDRVPVSPITTRFGTDSVR